MAQSRGCGKLGWARDLPLHCQWGARMTSLSGALDPGAHSAARLLALAGWPRQQPSGVGMQEFPSPPPPQGLLSSALYSHMPRFFPGPKENRYSPAQSISRRWVW